MFVSFEEVTEGLLEHLGPSAVISPALAQDFDCIDLALRLHDLNFKGMYRATAPDLPRPEVVEKEIAHLCPSIDFKIITSL